MIKSIPISQAQQDLPALPKRLAEEPGTVAVTRQGEPVLAILPWSFYESLVETLEVMADEELMAAVRQGAREAEEGRTIPWEDVKEELGL